MVFSTRVNVHFNRRNSIVTAVDVSRYSSNCAVRIQSCFVPPSTRYVSFDATVLDAVVCTFQFHEPPVSFPRCNKHLMLYGTQVTFYIFEAVLFATPVHDFYSRFSCGNPFVRRHGCRYCKFGWVGMRKWISVYIYSPPQRPLHLPKISAITEENSELATRDTTLSSNPPYSHGTAQTNRNRTHGLHIWYSESHGLHCILNHTSSSPLSLHRLLLPSPLSHCANIYL